MTNDNLQSRKPMIYLATPYSHPIEALRQHRFETINKIAAKIIATGKYHVFSPISHSHMLARLEDLPTGWDYWNGFDRKIITVCDILVVVQIDGWESSTGVAAEMKIADELGIPVVFMDPEWIMNASSHEANFIMGRFGGNK